MNTDIRKIRDSIATRRAELRHLKSGEVRAPLAIALGRVDSLIRAQAAEAAPLLSVLVPELTLADRAAPERFIDSRDHRALQALLVALLPDLIGDALKAKVKAQYAAGDLNSIDPAELPQRVAELEAELIALEVKDVALSQKHAEPLRPDTDARALLGIAA